MLWMLGKEELLSHVTVFMIGFLKNKSLTTEDSQKCHGSPPNYRIPHVTDFQFQRMKRANCFSVSVPWSIVWIIRVTGGKGGSVTEPWCTVCIRWEVCYALRHVHQAASCLN